MESATIRSIAIFSHQPCCLERIGITSIRVGTNSDLTFNAECKGNIDRDGIYACTNPQTGT